MVCKYYYILYTTKCIPLKAIIDQLINLLLISVHLLLISVHLLLCATTLNQFNRAMPTKADQRPQKFLWHVWPIQVWLTSTT